LTEDAAKTGLDSVRDMIVPWELAWEVFNVVTVPKFYNL